jgi:WD40 repeat protein
LSAEDQQASPRILSGHSSSVNSLAIDSNSRWLAAVGTSDASVRLWDLKTEDPGTSPRVIPPPRKSNGIWRVAISPDARWLFTSHFDRTAQLWDLSEEAPTPHELRGHNGVQSVAISPDGHWLATGCRTNAYLWDLTAADPASTARVLRGHDEAIWSVRISADSRWLVTDASDGTIRRWNLDTQWLLNHAREVAGRELTDEERVHYGVRPSREAGAAAASRTD